MFENEPRGSGRVRVRFVDGRILEIHVPRVQQCGGGSSTSIEPYFSIRRGNFVLKRGDLPGIFVSPGIISCATVASFMFESGAVLEINLPGASTSSAGTSTLTAPWFILRSPTQSILEQGPLPPAFFEFD